MGAKTIPNTLFSSMKIKALIVFLFLGGVVFSQDKKLDQLEMYFDQGYYKKVYRKSNILLDQPEYDYSLIPKYYKGISLLQLAQNDYWRKKHPDALGTALGLLTEVKSDNGGVKLFEAHVHELEWVKSDLASWASDLKRMNDLKSFDRVQEILNKVFGEINFSEENEQESVDTVIVNNELGVDRKTVIDVAEKQLGTPYVWAGNSPDGFDCSGFTSYVFGQLGTELPRRAADQYSKGTVVKEKSVKPGDLVFFDNGSGISHVGIVISNPGEPLKMIHSSSSKGIIITDVSASEYWQNRLYGFATYLK